MSLPDTNNQKIYQTPHIVRQYVGQKPLFPAEERVFRELAPVMKGRRILDLGVGGGRTTPHLLAISQEYVGLDYSAGMIDLCRERFPGVTFAVGDVREIERHVTGPFAWIVFSYNGIDYIQPEERDAVLRAIFRLLEPGGWFFFSTHNRNCATAPAWHPVHLARSWNPIRMGHYLLQWGRRILNAWNRRHIVRETPEFSWRVDAGFGFAMLTCYVHREDQLRQLRAVGFGDLASFDTDADPWIHYLARKPDQGW